MTCLLLPFHLEESPEVIRTFFGKNAGISLDSMVQLGVLGNIEYAAAGPSLGIVASEDQAVYSGQDQGTCAH